MPYNISTPGYYLPNYYGSMYPGNTFASTNTNQMQQSYAPAPQQPSAQGMIWVDGEVGAKAFQMPQGWPSGSPIALWDTNDTVIYLKSINQMGMPNPLQKIHYQMEEQQNLPAGQISGATQPAGNYATKDDLEQMKKDLEELLHTYRSQANQNGSQQNRGGAK